MVYKCSRNQQTDTGITQQLFKLLSIHYFLNIALHTDTYIYTYQLIYFEWFHSVEINIVFFTK